MHIIPGVLSWLGEALPCNGQLPLPPFIRPAPVCSLTTQPDVLGMESSPQCTTFLQKSQEEPLNLPPS